MGQSNDVCEKETTEPVEVEPQRRLSGMHRKRGGIVDVVTEVGKRLKKRQNRPILPATELDETNEA